jgi:large subunit ribosomal protein L25
MKSIELQAIRRKSLGKRDSRLLRKNNQVPCVMYGGKEILHFHAHENAFKNLVYTHHVYLVNLDIEGQKHQTIMKEIQFNPVSDRVDHIDFMEVAPDKEVIVDLPVEIVGNSVGIRSGGKLRQRKRYIKSKGFINKLPDSLVIDITNLDIGQSILAGDLKYEGVEIVESRHVLIVGVISSRTVAKESEEVTAAAAVAAPAAEAAKPEATAETKKA